VLQGRAGSARGRAAQAICTDLAVPLIRVDARRLLAAEEGLEHALRRLLVECRWRRAAVFLRDADALIDGDGRPIAEASRVLRTLATAATPLILAVPRDAHWSDLLSNERRMSVDLTEPCAEERLGLWTDHLARIGEQAAGPLEPLADRFVLTPGQIENAARAAADARFLSSNERKLEMSTLFAAARTESGQALRALASRVSTKYGWDDLVLPPGVLARVKMVAQAVRNWNVVHAQWGFGARRSTGGALRVLLSGVSGTGKGTCVSVIARELGVDLYRVDLSRIVSKYIGETEKNIERVFDAARYSNSILLFDEADAIFGRRSETKDAHDRYANIEVAYLLQKLEDEENETVVFLASNLSQNIDPAFARRMHYVVEFPLPAERQRRQLWQKIFPSEAPVAEDVDFAFLAKQFAISGGAIRNVALDAAFIAAQDGRVIRMEHVVRAMAREAAKEGKSATPIDFKQYHRLLTADD
jgi:AAA+ superfamily predicted ATPase